MVMLVAFPLPEFPLSIISFRISLLQQILSFLSQPDKLRFFFLTPMDILSQKSIRYHSYSADVMGVLQSVLYLLLYTTLMKMHLHKGNGTPAMWTNTSFSK